MEFREISDYRLFQIHGSYTQCFYAEKDVMLEFLFSDEQDDGQEPRFDSPPPLFSFGFSVFVVVAAAVPAGVAAAQDQETASFELRNA